MGDPCQCGQFFGVRDVNGGRPPGLNPDHFEIEPPEGTTDVGAPYEVDGGPMPDACRDAPGRPGVRICPLWTEALDDLAGEKGAEGTLNVRIRVDRKVPGARGAVHAVGKCDRTPGNDTVALTIEVSAPSRFGIGLTAVGGVATLGGWIVLLRRRGRRVG
ncbi:hypothetical protein [Streptomyces sp. YIM 130001]|uniref:hypothetical protein n=1 Tax=Streptomyces sp. YIM 130001 TaxID=2259644 RepID=UPI0013C4C2E6|nr:hypothetical protein [Streptomyces sp. YIM 130001]